MTPVNNYKFWLEEVCREYSVEKEAIIDKRSPSRYDSMARKVFYALCCRDGIDLYKLSITLGKHRSAAIHNLKRGRQVNKEIINKIWNNAKTRESKEGI